MALYEMRTYQVYVGTYYALSPGPLSCYENEKVHRRRSPKTLARGAVLSPRGREPPSAVPGAAAHEARALRHDRGPRAAVTPGGRGRRRASAAARTSGQRIAAGRRCAGGGSGGSGADAPSAEEPSSSSGRTRAAWRRWRSRRRPHTRTLRSRNSLFCDKDKLR